MRQSGPLTILWPIPDSYSHATILPPRDGDARGDRCHIQMTYVAALHKLILTLKQAERPCYKGFRERF